MLKHHWIRFLGALMVMGALTVALPGCGDNAAEPPPTSQDGVDPTLVNPTPESLESESGDEPY